MSTSGNPSYISISKIFQNDEVHNQDKQAPVNSLGIGIDFGTSNSAAAIFDGQVVSMVKLEKDRITMPSASYVDKKFQTTTGVRGIRAYIDGNQGRKVELSAEILGESRATTGQVDSESQLPTTASTNLVYGQAVNDASLPGRLFLGTKRLLGRANNERILIFNRSFRLVALITPILLRIQQALSDVVAKRDLIHGDLQVKANNACIGHPVNFEGNDLNHNKIALDGLSESYQHAGIIEQTFYPEPLAATISYLYHNPKSNNERVLTVDFGGGTLDLCVLRQQNNAYQVEAIHGIALGGDKIDQAIYKAILFPLLGKGERWSRMLDGYHVDTLFPFDDYAELLINWPVSYMLNQNKYTTPVIDRMGQLDPAAIKYKRLYELITQNYSYQVFQAIKQFKETLSSNEFATLDIPEIDIEVTVTRKEFDLIIENSLFLFDEAVLTTLHKANIQSKDIDLVLRTGGSSLIPAVKAILEKQFPSKVVEHDPFTSVAAGLAIADYYALGNKAEKS